LRDPQSGTLAELDGKPCSRVQAGSGPFKSRQDAAIDAMVNSPPHNSIDNETKREDLKPGAVESYSPS
jgi:hypothetical protein